MFPKNFKYIAPRSANEAAVLLKRYGPEAKVLAGGMSLIPIMKLRLMSPSYIIDVSRISALEYIKEAKGTLHMGALTRHRMLETSELLKQKLDLIPQTASLIGDPQVRNMGTIGGSLSHADPRGDWGSVVLAVRAKMKVVGRTDRVIPADDFFVDTFASALKPNELLTEIQIPTPPSRSGGAYAKFERRTGDFATVGVAAQLSIDRKGVCSYVGIGLTSLGPTNLRAEKAESLLLGKEVTSSIIDDAAERASEDAKPTSDPQGASVEYKKAMVRVFTKRALSSAFTKAIGGEKKW